MLVDEYHYVILQCVHLGLALSAEGRAAGGRLISAKENTEDRKRRQEVLTSSLCQSWWCLCVFVPCSL